MADYSDRYYTAFDGLRLYYRDYESAALRTPVLCIPGLTRNGRDFAFIAANIAQSRRVLVTDLRGRGRSAYDTNPKNYAVPVETADMLQLVQQLGLARVIVLGTSRGGVIAMTMATARPGLVAGAILNDIGAQVEPEGLEHIYAAMRQPPSYANWMEAVDGLKRYHAGRLRNIGEQQWLDFARSLYSERDGRIVGDYDPRFPAAILEGRGTNPRTDNGAADLWKWFAALIPVPVLVVRGENSDLLSQATVAAMQRAKPDLVAVTVKDRAHVPFLDEPEAVAVIDEFLQRIP